MKPQRSKIAKTKQGARPVKPSGHKTTVEPKLSASQQAALAQRVRMVIAPVIETQGLWLEDVVVRGNARARTVLVYLDYPDGTRQLGSAQLEEASRAVSAALDEVDVDPIPGAYTLEVSTLGAEHPLSNPRLFARAVGKDVEVRYHYEQVTADTVEQNTTGDGELVTVVGKLTEYGAETLTVMVPGKKGRPGQTEKIPLNTLESAKTVIVF